MAWYTKCWTILSRNGRQMISLSTGSWMTYLVGCQILYFSEIRSSYNIFRFISSFAIRFWISLLYDCFHLLAFLYAFNNKFSDINMKKKLQNSKISNLAQTRVVVIIVVVIESTIIIVAVEFRTRVCDILYHVKNTEKFLRYFIFFNSYIIQVIY